MFVASCMWRSTTFIIIIIMKWHLYPNVIVS